MRFRRRFGLLGLASNLGVGGSNPSRRASFLYGKTRGYRIVVSAPVSSRGDSRGAEPCEKVRRHLAFLESERFPVFAAPTPASIVARGRRDVRVSELLRHVAELDTRREELRCVGVAEILQRAVTDPSAPEDPPPLALAEVVGVNPSDDEGVGWRIEPLRASGKPPQGAAEAAREGHTALPARLRRLRRTSARAGLSDYEVTAAVVLIRAPGDRPPPEAERLAHPQTRVEEQQHERMGHRAFALSSGNFEGEAGSRDARS